MRVAIVRYNAGNVRSVANAVARLGIEAVVTDRTEDLLAADKVIFPGVGEASSAMARLREQGLDEAIRSLKQSVLAICLGMQLLCAASEENDTECLGILPYRVRRFSDGSLKVPHMGWNNVGGLASPIFDGIDDGSRVYFVHSYFVEKCDHATAAGFYGNEFTAAVEHRNFFGVQFHPERSGPTGARILKNFLDL